ncbi:MAG: hypothetical protein ACRDIB_05465, partial [Ardenticatenaceae bacterium]
MQKFRRAAIFALLAVLLLASTVAVYADVDITFFAGTWGDDAVNLAWGTGSEINISGFHVWRSEENLPIDENGQIPTSLATRLTEEPITAHNPCTPTGDESYTYVDDTVSDNVDVYYYYLEAIDQCIGTGSEFVGDGDSGLEVTNPGPPNLYLPITITE